MYFFHFYSVKFPQRYSKERYFVAEWNRLPELISWRLSCRSAGVSHTWWPVPISGPCHNCQSVAGNEVLTVWATSADGLLAFLMTGAGAVDVWLAVGVVGVGVVEPRFTATDGLCGDGAWRTVVLAFKLFIVTPLRDCVEGDHQSIFWKLEIIHPYFQRETHYYGNGTTFAINFATKFMHVGIDKFTLLIYCHVIYCTVASTRDSF